MVFDSWTGYHSARRGHRPPVGTFEVSITSSADLSRYYDFMHLWTRFNSGFRSFSGHGSNAIHRWLTDVDSGEFSPNTIHRIMLSLGIGADAPVEALDA